MGMHVSRFVSTLSHAAVFAGMYVGAATVCFGQLSGLQAGPSGALGLGFVFAALTGAGVYLMDRVKLRDVWMDPADGVAQPARQRILGGTPARARRTRWAAAGMCLGGACVGMWITPLAPAMVVIAVLGVVVYAGRPRHGEARARVKDRLIVKDAFVGMGIAGFAGVVTAAGNTRTEMVPAIMGTSAWLFAGGQVAARVFADACLCDLDDEHSDRLHRTQTLATRLGRERAWTIAMSVRLIAAGLLVMVPVGPRAARWAWAAVTVVSTVGLRMWSPARLRDIVDVRMVVEAAAVAALLHGLA
jgi:4-hydroxybenzoate polyprenyltransferase